MKQQLPKGFELSPLMKVGIVIVVLLLLSMVAPPRFGNSTASMQMERERLAAYEAKNQAMPASAPAMDSDQFYGGARQEANEEGRAAGAAGNNRLYNQPGRDKAVAANAQSQVAGAATPTQTDVLRPQLIRRGNISLEVDKLKEALAKINGLVAVNGGYITNQTLSYEDSAGSFRSGQLEVRVPQRNFDNFMEQLQALGKTPGPQISAEDVGKQMSDLQATIRNKQKEEEQLQQIMKRSGKVNEVLEVARELARVRGEIEQAQGSLQYYKEQVAYSTVTIYISEKVVGSPTEDKPTFGQFVENTFKDSLSGLYNFALGVVAFAIHFLVLTLPTWIFTLLVVFALYKLLDRLLLRRAWAWWQQNQASREEAKGKPQPEASASASPPPAEENP